MHTAANTVSAGIRCLLSFNDTPSSLNRIDRFGNGRHDNTELFGGVLIVASVQNEN